MEKGFPISPDRAIFLADAHLNQDDLHSRNFLALIDRAAAEKVPLFLLGDVFDLWFGNPGLTFAFQKPIVERLRQLRGEGLRIYYVEGNRDFYLKRDHEGRRSTSSRREGCTRRSGRSGCTCPTGTR